MFWNRAPKVPMIPLEDVMRELETLVATAGIADINNPGVILTPNQNARIWDVMERLRSKAQELHLKDNERKP